MPCSAHKLWLLNNTIDLVIWIINIVKGTVNAEMTLIMSVMYLVMNVIGLICWIKIERKQKLKTNLNKKARKVCVFFCC